MVLFTRDSTVKLFIDFPVSGINTAIADHLIVLFGDVSDKAFNNLFKRRIDQGFHFIEKSSAESVTEVSIVEMLNVTPEAVVAVAAFRNKAVDIM